MTRLQPRPKLPVGTVTFLFTDIEGSTRLLRALGERYESLLAEHAAILRAAIAAGHGVEVSTEGDAFFAAFPSVSEGVGAAADAQRALAAHAWPADGVIRVRMGLHTGEGRLGGDNYTGIDVNRAARVAAAAHGGQVLISGATRVLVERALPAGVTLHALGDWQLKDFDAPEPLTQLVIEGLDADFPPPRAGERRDRLPHPQTSFVGRSADIAEVRRLLRERRLVTLTGPGGTGKTRLGLEVARGAAPDHEEGAVFVALDALRDPGLVASAIAQALEVQENGRPVEEALGEFLAPRDVLLMLDNFEQVVEAAPVVDRLLAAAARVRLLVTSRIPLHLYGEQEYAVAPLELPQPDRLPPLEALSQYEGVALFIDRARAVRPGFAVTNENAPAVAEICIRLDGLPLAIELAAARTKLLSPQAILDRLGHRLELLAGQSPNLPARQRTLRAAIDWSHALLEPAEERLFACLAVFAGGWEIDAAGAVCDPGGQLGIDPLEGIGSLLDKSLVRRDERGIEPRFFMLQTIQEYAAERLEASGEADDMRRRHAEYFRELVERAEPELVGQDPATCVQRLIPDQDNLRAALAWSIGAGVAEPGLRLASAGWRFWQLRGLLREGHGWLGPLLGLPDAAAPSVMRARGLTARGGIRYWQGDLAARSDYEEALRIYRSLDDATGIAESLNNLGYLAMSRSETGEARRLFTESLQRYRDLGDERNVANVAGAVGYVDMLDDRFDAAQRAIEEALVLNRKLGQRARANDSEFALGQVHRLSGNYAEARRWYRQALEDILGMADASRTLVLMAALSALAQADGRQLDALRLAGAVERNRNELGGSISVAMLRLPDPVESARAAGVPEHEIQSALAAGRELDLQAGSELARRLAADAD